MNELKAAIRRGAPSAVWSQGVKLVRRDVVSGESQDDEEIVLRVAAASHGPAPTVVLYLGDQEWDCDCPSRAEICAHVVAAVLAVEKAGGLPTSSAAGGQLEYHLVPASGGLGLERWVVRPGAEPELLKHTLQSLVADGKSGIAATQLDLQVDRLLGLRTRGRIPDDRLENLFQLMSGSDHVRYGGAPIRLSTDEIRPLARVVNYKRGVALHIERDPAVDEVVASRIARIGDSLHLIAETELSGRRLEKLPFEQVFAAGTLGELTTRLLPQLRQRTALTIETDRIPGVDANLPPRLAIELDQREGMLTALATLVYGDPPQARIDGGRLVHLGGNVPLRDNAAEARLLRRLRDELGMRPGHRAILSGEAAAEFADKLRGFRGDLRGAKILDAPELQVDIRVLDDRLTAHFEVGEDHADTRQVLAAWQHGVQLVPLAGGGFARLPTEWLGQHGERLTSLLAARDSTGALPAHTAPELARFYDELEEPHPAFADRLAPLVEGFGGLPRRDLPADLTAELRPYQREGVDWLRFLASAGLGGILADDMGLGKTLQTLCAVEGRVLVVCPRSVLHNWAAEIRRFRPACAVHTYHGPGRALAEGPGFTLTTYGVLRQDIDTLAHIHWDACVLDEAQAIKNPESQNARAARRLRAALRLALSGTPIENRLEELWSLMAYCNPGLLGARSEFREQIAVPAESGDAKALTNLRTRIRPFVLRRLKRDVLPDLPVRTDSVLYVDLDTEERQVYDTVRAGAQSEIVRLLDRGGNVLAALEALLRLRQACCHPSLVPGQRAESSSKLELLTAKLVEAHLDGHKALVFSQWTSVLDLIEPALQDAQVPFTRLDGSTRNREAVVNDFQAENGPPVLLISLKAGGTGLNLTAADHVFLFDPWWNPATEDQAADRAHRIGQTNPVNVYRLVATDTVEERILALQERKRAVASAALDGTGAAAGLSREDLLGLLGS